MSGTIFVEGPRNGGWWIMTHAGNRKVSEGPYSRDEAISRAQTMNQEIAKRTKEARS
jgi:hypothetical protein